MSGLFILLVTARNNDRFFHHFEISRFCRWADEIDELLIKRTFNDSVNCRLLIESIRGRSETL